MAAKKKAAKKFEYTRADVAARLTELEDKLDELDVYATSPSELVDLIVEISQELNDVKFELTEEKYPY